MKILQKRFFKFLLKKLPFKFDGISIDSKKVKKNNIFVAIKGKKRDGHNYTKDAIKKVASFCVVTKKQNVKRCFTFKNSNKFLKKFAKNNRMSSKAKIIGVTGSTGKTSLKNLLGKLLIFIKALILHQDLIIINTVCHLV